MNATNHAVAACDSPLAECDVRNSRAFDGYWLMSCPKCGCEFDLEWCDANCPGCGLGYKIDTVGEMWSDDEYPIISSWERFEPMDPFDCGVNAYYATKDKSLDMFCPWDDDTDENIAWSAGWLQAERDSE